ncbi:MAG: molybdopterin molybdotransferase MoeA, partial [Cyclobacteriaceae bacterium]|nr:molybdopterin molybdotransferase MoeA [Cyclobacteriaceae bacterium]
MILTSEALATVLSNTRDYGTVIVPIEKATGRTLAQDITADRDFPPFDRVMMDGIAINSSAFSSGLRSFIVEGTQFAGSPRLQLSSEEHCLEVMTGAMLPLHADCVVRYEDITIENWRATINLDTVAPFQHVHRQGSDRKSGEVLLREGTAIRPPEIAVLSTVGMEKIEVKKLPKVAIIYTGDELVGIHETPQPHQIRASNNYAIRAGLFSRGIKSDWFHLHDEKEVIRESVGAILESHDVIILSG